MFPQSELDNYKLQVELLQDKLQRSEISRQQLEHKLDKILQKRDEHDKTVRSKARQKYQTFLEEQQRRNERNKQLVQMLERIEQQTEAMNARSERLKMMKLQYEMYFAKLVHSQTRRCIQNSVTPLTPMMPSTSGQSMVPTAQPTVREEYNYEVNKDAHPLLMSTTNQSYVTIPTVEKQQFLRSQTENMPLATMEMPTLANFDRAERNDYIDFRNLNTAPSIQNQQPYQYPSNHEIISNNVVVPNNNNYIKQESPENSNASSIINSNMTLSPVTNLLANDKQLAEFKEPTNISTTNSSSTFEEIPNVSMRPQIPHNLKEIPRTTNTTTTTNNIRNSNDARQLNMNFQVLQKPSQHTNGTSLTSTQQINNNSTNAPQNNKQNINTVNEISPEIRNEIKSPAFNAVNEHKPQDVAVPKLMNKPSTSIELKPTNSLNETLTSNNTNFGNSQPAPNEQTNIANATLAPADIQSNSSTTPVSIENIENAIYGELLSPLETNEVPNSENSNVVPMLLENLVTQAENNENVNITLDETTLKQDKVADNNTSNDTTTLAENRESENNPVSQNYEQTIAYNEYNNNQTPDETANAVADYNNYENVENTAIDDSQQQQQYDYTNYDPTQYSYPGYIYDETTGEYKPDPNAPAEQYATDQQYTTENYDQQYQQQEIYDYNQTYEQDPTTSSATVENTAYNNYETTQQEDTSNDAPVNANAVQQQPITETEPIAAEPEISTEEVTPSPSTKVTKPTSILSTADKNDAQKKKKRVNFVDSSETDESAGADKGAPTTAKAVTGNTAASSESDFDFSSSTEAEAKAT
ncbi:putative uncharacterized protein DDB_G0282499 [Calliphora vicina]|uniref:putative uncharacterized protein DDB_G0282499 n=1 Tax=Calliphora vicina TaxID=7373 RepID=UPI00325B786B